MCHSFVHSVSEIVNTFRPDSDEGAIECGWRDDLSWSLRWAKIWMNESQWATYEWWCACYIFFFISRYFKYIYKFSRFLHVNRLSSLSSLSRTDRPSRSQTSTKKMKKKKIENDYTFVSIANDNIDDDKMWNDMSIKENYCFNYL